MPIHEWRCEGCGEVKEVIRSFEDYNKPPEESCKSCEETRWSKFLSKAPQGAKGANWGAGKGNWLVLFGILCLGMLSRPAQAEPLITADAVAFETYKVGTFRDADFPDAESQNDRGIAFVIDLSVFKYIEWHNRVWTNGNEAKLHTVGWEYDIAFSINEYFEVFHYHHSQHSMDEPTVAARFPLRNYYGARFNFIPNKEGP